MIDSDCLVDLAVHITYTFVNSVVLRFDISLIWSDSTAKKLCSFKQEGLNES